MLASLERQLAAKTREAERLAAALSRSGSNSSGGGGASSSSTGGASAAAELDVAKRQVCVAGGCVSLPQPIGLQLAAR